MCLTTQYHAIDFEVKFLADYSFFQKSWMFTGSKVAVLSHCCGSFPTHWKWLRVFHWVPFHVSRCTRTSGSMGYDGFLFAVKIAQTRAKIQGELGTRGGTVKVGDVGNTLWKVFWACASLRWLLALSEKGLVWISLLLMWTTCQSRQP